MKKRLLGIHTCKRDGPICDNQKESKMTAEKMVKIQKRHIMEYGKDSNDAMLAKRNARIIWNHYYKKIEK